MKVDGIGACCKRSVVVIRVKLLYGEGLPSACRASVDKSSPALTQSAKLFFNRRNQFVLDCVSVRSDIGGIHRIRIVVIRVGVLDLDDEHARESGRCPLLIKLVGFLLLDPVIAGKMESFAIVGLQVRVGWRGAEVAEIGYEMIVKDNQRKMRIGMLIESFGHKHNRTDEHGPPPELCQHLALNPDMPDILGICRYGDGGNHFCQRDIDRSEE